MEHQHSSARHRHRTTSPPGSPLGVSVRQRLGVAVLASGALWLAILWAVGA